jgi:hypothetical protein
MSGGTALADASWGGCTDGLSLRINHRKDGAISVRETDRGALGLVPLEDSSGNRRRLGHITKQRSSILRFLLVEAAQVTARSIPEWRNKYVHLTMRRGRKSPRWRWRGAWLSLSTGCGARDGITSS